MPSLPYREQVLRLREDAIVEAVNRLLVSKGYDLMTVDEVAAEAGLAKASLYKHFTSKEELAAAAMVRVLGRALAHVAAQQESAPAASALLRIELVLRWTLRVQLDGEMPSLPAQNSRLTAALRAHKVYMDRLIELSEVLGLWIHAAQAAGDIDPDLPAELVLYTLFARACDPVLGLLKAAGQHSDGQIIEWLVGTTLRGLAGPPRAGARRAAVRPPPQAQAGTRRKARTT